jgi:hypothetical protein
MLWGWGRCGDMGVGDVVGEGVEMRGLGKVVVLWGWGRCCGGLVGV